MNPKWKRRIKTVFTDKEYMIKMGFIIIGWSFISLILFQERWGWAVGTVGVVLMLLEFVGAMTMKNHPMDDTLRKREFKDEEEQKARDVQQKEESEIEWVRFITLIEKLKGMPGSEEMVRQAEALHQLLNRVKNVQGIGLEEDVYIRSRLPKALANCLDLMMQLDDTNQKEMTPEIERFFKSKQEEVNQAIFQSHQEGLKKRLRVHMSSTKWMNEGGNF